jgi:LEA14-like dessication related protein
MSKRSFYFIAFASALLLTACSNFKEIECTGVKGFKVNKINTEGISADIFLGIKNPNNYGFSIYKSECDVTYSGIYLGRAKLTKRVRIKAKEEETYGFTLSSDFKDVNVMSVLKLLNGASRKDLLEVKGEIKTGKFFMTKKMPVDVKEKIGIN